MQLLKIANDHRHIETETGERFYLIGDTAWELFHRLDREEATRYLETRREQGFNFIHAVVLAELDGLRTPNRYGRTPLKKNAAGEYDPTMPDDAGEYSYFDHVEFILSEAERLGLYVGLLPTWGDKYNMRWGKGPLVLNGENAYIYAKWLAERVKHHNNIVWILGGDRPLECEEHFAVNDAMAKGVREGDGGKFLITLHPTGSQSSSQFVHDREWLDFNMMQSGHRTSPAPEAYEMIARDRALTPVKPTMDGEQRYEDHPKSFKAENGYFDAADVREAMWRNLLSGACGNTYGHSSVWCMRTERTAYWPNTWEESLRRPAAEQMRHYAAFIADNDLTAHTPTDAAVENNARDANYVQAMVSPESVYLYIPNGIPVKLAALPFEPKSVTVFEPTTGEYHTRAAFTDGTLTFPGRGAGRGMDAVVILR